MALQQVKDVGNTFYSQKRFLLNRVYVSLGHVADLAAGYRLDRGRQGTSEGTQQRDTEQHGNAQHGLAPQPAFQSLRQVLSPLRDLLFVPVACHIICTGCIVGCLSCSRCACMCHRHQCLPWRTHYNLFG